MALVDSNDGSTNSEAGNLMQDINNIGSETNLDQGRYSGEKWKLSLNITVDTDFFTVVANTSTELAFKNVMVDSLARGLFKLSPMHMASPAMSEPCKACVMVSVIVILIGKWCKACDDGECRECQGSWTRQALYARVWPEQIGGVCRGRGESVTCVYVIAAGSWRDACVCLCVSWQGSGHRRLPTAAVCEEPIVLVVRPPVSSVALTCIARVLYCKGAARN